MNKLFRQILGFGVVSGMRITFAPAFLSHYFNKHPEALRHSRLNFMTSPKVARFASLQMVLEIITDKNPYAPDRTGRPQIFLRIGSGAFAGAVLAKANAQPVIKGVLLGGVAALAATYGALFVRTTIDRSLPLKDTYTGAIEDVIALGAAALLSK